MASGTPAEIWECFWKAVEVGSESYAMAMRQGMNNAQKHGLLEYAAGGCASEGRFWMSLGSGSMQVSAASL